MRTVRPRARTAPARKRGEETRRRPAKAGKTSKNRAKRPLKARRRGGSTSQQLATWLREGGRTDRCAALIVVQERAGQEFDESIETCAIGDTSVGEKRGRGATRRSSRGGKRGGRISATTCRALAAVGHAQRSKIMAKLLEGPATYRALQRVTKLKAGPLYHHVNQLRLAGLMLPKERDLYELTRGGRNLILTVMAMGKLIRDTKRRPIATD